MYITSLKFWFNCSIKMILVELKYFHLVNIKSTVFLLSNLYMQTHPFFHCFSKISTKEKLFHCVSIPTILLAPIKLILLLVIGAASWLLIGCSNLEKVSVTQLICDVTNVVSTFTKQRRFTAEPIEARCVVLKFGD